MHQLLIQDDAGQTIQAHLGPDVLSIGRKDDNAIRLTERNVSRHHARLVRRDGAYYIEDLGSYTGVRVNGRRIEAPTPLGEGDQVRIGDYCLQLVPVTVPAEPVPAPSPAVPPAPVVGPAPPPGDVEPTRQVLAPGPRPRGRLLVGTAAALASLALIAAGTLLGRPPAPRPPGSAQARVAPPLLAAASVGAPEPARPPAPAPVRPAVSPVAAPAPPAPHPRPRPHPHPAAPVLATHAPGALDPGASAPVPIDAEAAYAEAMRRYVNQDYAEALRVIRQAHPGGPMPLRAWRLVGAAACNLHDLRQVTEAYRHLDPAGQRYLIYVCQPAGLAYADGRFERAE